MTSSVLILTTRAGDSWATPPFIQSLVQAGGGCLAASAAAAAPMPKSLGWAYATTWLDGRIANSLCGFHCAAAAVLLLNLDNAQDAKG